MIRLTELIYLSLQIDLMDLIVLLVNKSFYTQYEIGPNYPFGLKIDVYNFLNYILN